MDGLTVNVSLSIQYIIKDNLNDVLQLYYKYGIYNYYRTYYLISRDVIEDTFSNFYSKDLFVGRANIAFFLEKSVSQALDQEHATLANFQLLDIFINENFNMMLLLIQNQNLLIKSALNSQSAKINQLENEKIKAKITSDNIKLNAIQNYNKLYNKCSYNSQNKMFLIKQITPSLVNLKSNLGYTTKDIIKYFKSYNIDQNETNKFINDLDINEPRIFSCLEDNTDNYCK